MSMRLPVVFGSLSVASIIAAVILLLTGSSPSTGGDSEVADGPIDRGVQLFIDKGCIRCHSHERALAEVEGVQPMSDIGAYGSGIGLTDYSADPEFLREWLADPAAVRPQTRMPDLNLDDDEIELLIAFLNEIEAEE